MIGKSEAAGWIYDFSCRGCIHLEDVNQPEKKRNGTYCIEMISRIDKGESGEIIHADDDRHLRCDCYAPAQKSLF